MVKTACIAAEHGWFIRIRQVAPINTLYLCRVACVEHHVLNSCRYAH